MITVIDTILDQHVEEASFLWHIRSRATHAPHYSVADLAKLDHRLEAHLDGLRTAGEEGWRVCQKELSWEEPGEVFAAAVLAFGPEDEERISEVVNVASVDPALARGLISALGWLSYEQAERYIKKFLASDSAFFQRIGVAAVAIHRVDVGTLLTQGASDADPLLKARALRAIGELGRLDLLPIVQQNLEAEDEECRFSAAWSSALLTGEAKAPHILQSIAESQSPHAQQALLIAIRRMDLASAHDWHTKLSRNEKSIRRAVIAAGVIGDSALIPWLISVMSDPALARVAGEAFSSITGVDIPYADLDRDKPEGFDAGPTEDPKDENVEMDPDEHLAWPDPIAIRNWWDKHQSNFTPGTRNLCGKPITAEWLHQVLRTGRQRNRAAAAVELAFRNPGRPLFNVKSPGFRQQHLLGVGHR